MNPATTIKLEEESDLKRCYSIGDDMILSVSDETHGIVEKVTERTNIHVTKKVRERAYSKAPLEERSYGFHMHLKRLDKGNYWVVSYDPPGDLIELRVACTELDFGRAFEFEKLVLELMQEVEAKLAPVKENQDVDFVLRSISEYRSWRKQNLEQSLSLYADK